MCSVVYRENSSQLHRMVHVARMVLMVIFFVFLKLCFFYFTIVIYDLVHDVEAIFHHLYPLTASGNIF